MTTPSTSGVNGVNRVFPVDNPTTIATIKKLDTTTGTPGNKVIMYTTTGNIETADAIPAGTTGGGGGSGAFTRDALNSLIEKSVVGGDSLILTTVNANNLNFNSGDDRKMIYNQSLSAFRSGTVSDIPAGKTGVDWDVVNCGQNSVGFGYNTRASGDQSLSFGTASANGNVTASGLESVTSGYALNGNILANNRCSFNRSYVAGIAATPNASVTTSSGVNSFLWAATEDNATVNATNRSSVAIGTGYNTSDITSSGISSLVVAYCLSSGIARATGNNSTVLSPHCIGGGEISEATAPGSVVIAGRDCRVGNQQGTIQGWYATAGTTTVSSILANGSWQLGSGRNTSNRDTSVRIGTRAFGSVAFGAGLADAWISGPGADEIESLEKCNTCDPSFRNSNDKDTRGYLMTICTHGYAIKANALTPKDELFISGQKVMGTAGISMGFCDKHWHDAVKRDWLGGIITRLSCKRDICDIMTIMKVDTSLTALAVINADTETMHNDLLLLSDNDFTSNDPEFNINDFRAKVAAVEYIPITVLNSSYDPKNQIKPYKCRRARDEWSAYVSNSGKVWVREDGTAIVGKKVSSNNSGKATNSLTGFFVLKKKVDANGNKSILVINK